MQVLLKYESQKERNGKPGKADKTRPRRNLRRGRLCLLQQKCLRVVRTMHGLFVQLLLLFIVPEKIRIAMRPRCSSGAFMCCVSIRESRVRNSCSRSFVHCSPRAARIRCTISSTAGTEFSSTPSISHSTARLARHSSSFVVL